MLGEPKAGKTSLLRRLKENDYRENEVQTDGINIESLEFGDCGTFQDYTAIHDWTGHFWDFGGQEIMNNTHQFFLTQRSLYILLLDARKDNNISAQIRKWLQRIKATGGDSTVIVVANKIDINPGFGFDNEYELKEEFPQIAGFIKASCCTNEEIETIKSILSDQILQSEHTSIDRRWIAIKDELEERTSHKHFLNETEFRSICRTHDLTEKSQQKNAIEFFHDLGMLLHFKNLNLAEYFVLAPYWITYGVYQIVTSNLAGKLQGTVSIKDLEYIVNEEEEKQEIYKPSHFKRIPYSTAERRFLVDILHEFKLCFYGPDREYFILPDLLPTAEPRAQTEPMRSDENAIRFVYQYTYLPKSILLRIMVDAHHLLLNKWRTGCVLEINDCQVLLTDYQDRINITVVGEHKKKREALSVIRHWMDSEINPTISEPPLMLIPLPGTKEYADYEELIEREKEGERTYRIFRPVKKSFEISKLLEGIAPKDPSKAINDKLDQLLKGNQQLQQGQAIIINKFDDHYQYLIQLSSEKGITAEIIEETITRATREQSQDLTEDLMQFLVTVFSNFDKQVGDKLQPIYEELQKTEDTQLKLKLGLPLACLTGIQLEGEFDLKSWGSRMYDKYGFLLFKKMMGVE